MTDTPTLDTTQSTGASSLMNQGGPQVTAPPDHKSAAYARIGVLQRDPEFQAKLIRGDAEARQEWAALKITMAQPTGLTVRGQLTEGQGNNALDRLQENANLSPAELQQIGQPVSAEEMKLATHELNRLKRDKEFVRRLFDGDRQARGQWDRLHLIISSPVKLAAQ
jgi:hypothetical protein